MSPQPTRRNPRILFALWFPVLVAVAGAATQVSLAPDRPTAVVGEIVLPASGDTWTSDPIKVDATAIGLSWVGSEPRGIWVRASEDGDAWGEWTAVHNPEDHGPDVGSREAESASPDNSEAIYVGKAGWLRFKIDGAPSGVKVSYVDTSGRSRTLWEKALSVLDRLRFARDDAALALPDRPAIQPRSSWGGDECRARGSAEKVEYVDRVQLLVVHHTVHGAGANTYTAEEVPDLLYAICSYHVSAQGWDDMGYNVLIDRFGTVWEGRAGGVDQPVLGAHTGGFNSYSTGVAFIGDHNQMAPSAGAQAAFVNYAAWKLDLYHIDPLSTATVDSLGSSRFPEGVEVTLPAVAGHRDASVTSCPGDASYALLAQWRNRIAAIGGPKIYGGWPALEPVPGFQATGYQASGFPIRFTEEMSWVATVVDGLGVALARFEGVGTEAIPVWDGTDSSGAPQPFGDYTMTVDAVPTSGAVPPRSVNQSFQLGSYNPPFSDDEGSVHEADIATIFNQGITTGCGLEVYCPKAEVLRWQMALFLTRLHTAAGFILPDPLDQGFTDIAQLETGYREAIDRLARLGITSGTGEGLFSPNQSVTRWQMALFLIRELELAGAEIPTPIYSGFTDIGNLTLEQQTAINQLAQLGITTGTNPSTFSPDGPVSREQMASFLARTLTILRPNPNGSP